jgi:hypothetical protein
VAKKHSQQSEKPSRKRVLQYAAELREQAAKARAADPNVELYAPSDDAARKVFEAAVRRVGKEDAGAAALVELARRAAQRELNVHEAEQRAEDGRRRLLELQLINGGEREAAVQVLSLGERLDLALWTLGLASEAKVSKAFDEQSPIRGGKGGAGLPWTSDRHGELARDALGLVERLEREAERSRRRLVEEGVAA